MEIRNPVHPRDFKAYTTERIRDEFLIQDLFLPGQIKLVYSHFDRMIVGGVCPEEPISLAESGALGTGFFLERREMGIVNVGARGMVRVDGKTFVLDTQEGLYVGMGQREIVFSSAGPSAPSRFYLNSGPAHHAHPVTKIELGQTETSSLGSQPGASIRTLRKLIHPQGVQSCQLVMGITTLEPGNVWSAMPCHIHPRRMEVYFYFDLAPGAAVFHLMGEPDETRHVVIRNEEAVISPSWSIHTGVGSSSYSFIWGMLGENQSFADTDVVAIDDLA
jgi:4-deoxy-L-threo-5-hexosulose-uronate ketol-isomerase